MRFGFRPLHRGDFGLLATWLADPEVAAWWHHEWTPEALERDFGPAMDGTEPGEDLVADVDGRAIGLVQRSRIVDHPQDREQFTRLVGAVDPGAREIDYLIGAPGDRGRGVGPAMIDAIVRQTFAVLGEVPYILVAVERANRRSWRAVEKAGFHRVAEGAVAVDGPAGACGESPHLLFRRDRE